MYIYIYEQFCKQQVEGNQRLMRPRKRLRKRPEANSAALQHLQGQSKAALSLCVVCLDIRLAQPCLWSTTRSPACSAANCKSSASWHGQPSVHRPANSACSDTSNTSRTWDQNVRDLTARSIASVESLGFAQRGDEETEKPRKLGRTSCESARTLEQPVTLNQSKCC